MVSSTAQAQGMTEEKPRKIGRPSLKTPELLEEFCRRIGAGRSVASVCRDEDMPEDRSIWRWLSEDEGFSRDYARAIQARAMHHADEIIETIQQVKRGELPPDAARVALDAMKWTASRLLPKVYGDKQTIEASVTHTHTLHLEALRALSGKRSGYIEGQAIEIPSDPTFSGERQDAQDRAPMINMVTETHSGPPLPGLVPPPAAAPATSPRTRKKRSDPSPRPVSTRKPRTPKNKK